MRSRYTANKNSTFHQPAPAEVVLKGTEECLAACSQQGDLPVVRTFYMGNQGLQVKLPELQFVLRKMTGIDDLLKVETSRSCSQAEPPFEFASQPTEFARHKPMALLWLQSGKIAEPVAQVASETPYKPGPIQGDTFIARICGGRVDENDQGDFLALQSELPRHLISHVAAEAVSAQIIRTLRLTRPDYLQVGSSHRFQL